MRRYRRLLALPAAALATAALATSALAVPPERFIHEIYADDVIPSTECGFPIAVHAEGTVRETMFFNADGEWVRAMDSAIDFKESWTNMLTGASAWTVHTGAQHLTLNDDGVIGVLSALQARQATLFATAWCARGRCPTAISLPDAE